MGFLRFSRTGIIKFILPPANKNTVKIFLIAVLFCVFSAAPASSEDSVLTRIKDYNSGIPVRIVKKISLPEGYHEGVFSYKNEIWVSNGKGGNTWIINPEDGSITSEIKSIGSFTEGITVSGNSTFWVTDWEDKKLYRVKIQDGKMEEEYAITIKKGHPAGLVWTGEAIYVITWERGLGTKYYLLKFSEDGNIYQKIRIKGIHEPAHLAWDGVNLWITSWYSQLVYKVDIRALEVVDFFKSPASDTTGIAWDGKYFWITGTNADLYKVEIR